MDDHEEDSWEDSERFEEDSLGSWYTDPESLCQNWRGWAPRSTTTAVDGPSYTGGIRPSTPPRSTKHHKRRSQPSHLLDISAAIVARHCTFDQVEAFAAHNSLAGFTCADNIQLKLAQWCFPTRADDIRLYSCLAHGNAEEYCRGETLYRMQCVRRVLQIGFHLSAVVIDGGRQPEAATSSTHLEKSAECRVAVTVDRCKIVSCECSVCGVASQWCAHIVALCLHRMHNDRHVTYRVPLSESLDLLDRADAPPTSSSASSSSRCTKCVNCECQTTPSPLLDSPSYVQHGNKRQLKKFAQYFISELPREYLPTAQRLLDELLSRDSEIYRSCGAPDPTAGGVGDQVAIWSMDEETLSVNIRRILSKFCIPSPTVFSDVSCLSSQQPQIASDWQSLLRPLRSREPEGICNLLSIVKEMFRRNDQNATSLLHIITEKCLSYTQVIIWWYNTRLAQSARYPIIAGGAGYSSNSSGKSGLACNVQTAQYSCATLCANIVEAWRIAALNPRLAKSERRQLAEHLVNYHRSVLEMLWNVLCKQSEMPPTAGNRVNAEQTRLVMTVAGYGRLTQQTALFDVDAFDGFHPAIQACHMDWKGQTISGITSKEIDDGMASLCVDVGATNGGSIGGYSPNMPILHRNAKPSPSADMPSTSGAGRKEEIGTPDVDISDIVGESSSSTSSGPESGQCSSFDATTPQLDARTAQFSYMIEMYIAQNDGLAEEEGVAPEVDVHTPTLVDMPSPVTTIIASLEDMVTVVDAPLINFSRCASLRAHGMEEQAFVMATALAKQLIARPSELDVATPADVAPPTALLPSKNATMAPTSGSMGKGRKKPKGAMMNEQPLIAHDLRRRQSSMTVDFLARCELLVGALIDTGTSTLALRLGIVALSTRRNAAVNKYDEVHNYHADHSIAQSLKSIGERDGHLIIYREEAHRLMRIDADMEVLPLCLATLVFDALTNDATNSDDVQLGYDAALFVLAMKSTVGEAANGILCERHRRERGEMALKMMMYSKDNVDQLARVLNALLDCKTHKLFTQHTQCNNCIYHVLRGHSHTHCRQHINNDGVERKPSEEPPSSKETSSSHSPPSSASSTIGRRHSPTNQQTTNEASEAHAHYMHELAKRVLTEAGGNHTTALIFNNVGHHAVHAHDGGGAAGVHRQLQLSAFLIGVYALGVLNEVTPTWLSRTYSAHVSWLTSQAIDIGRVAIRLLVDVWTGHLTPSEVATLADKASQTREVHNVAASADLALSVLPHAHALGQAEIKRALEQCKEQSTVMLERACVEVEEAANKYGVIPEVVFAVAYRWQNLHDEQVKSDTARGRLVAQQQQPPHQQQQQPPQQPPNNVVAPVHMVYNSPPPPQPNMIMRFPPPTGPPPPPHLMQQMMQQQQQQRMFYQQHQHHSAPNLHPSIMAGRPQFSAMPPVVEHASTVDSSHANRHLSSAYRVGMLALQLLAKRIDEDRSYLNKYSQNPPYRDSIEWLFKTAHSLGHAHTYQLCISIAASVLSPFLLYDMCYKASLVFSPNHALLVAPSNGYPFTLQARQSTEALRVALDECNRYTQQPITHLIQKCLAMFYAAAALKLSHPKFQSSDAEEICILIKAAKHHLHSLPRFGLPHDMGPRLFADLMQFVRGQRASKKEVWQKIVEAASAPVQQ